MPIDCTIKVAGSVPAQLATLLDDERGKLTSAKQVLEGVKTAISTAMIGETCQAIIDTVDTRIIAADASSDRLLLLGEALNALGECLAVVEDEIYAVLTDAKSQGLVVIDGSIQLPHTNSTAYTSLLTFYQELEQVVSTIREYEATAHTAFKEACKEINMLSGAAQGAASAIEAGLTFDEWAGTEAAWWMARGSGIEFVDPARAEKMTKLRASIQAREPAEVVAEIASAGHIKQRPGILGAFLTKIERAQVGYKRMFARTDYSNWTATDGPDSPKGQRLATGATILKFAKIASYAGAALSVGEATYDQWKDDSIDPSLGEGERIARAATHGLLEGAGAFFGSCLDTPVGTGGGDSPAQIGLGMVFGNAIGTRAGRWFGARAADKLDDAWKSFFSE